MNLIYRGDIPHHTVSVSYILYTRRQTHDTQSMSEKTVHTVNVLMDLSQHLWQPYSKLKLLRMYSSTTRYSMIRTVRTVRYSVLYDIGTVTNHQYFWYIFFTRMKREERFFHIVFYRAFAPLPVFSIYIKFAFAFFVIVVVVRRAWVWMSVKEVTETQPPATFPVWLREKRRDSGDWLLQKFLENPCNLAAWCACVF